MHCWVSLRTYDMHLRYNGPIEGQVQRTDLLHCLVWGCYTSDALSWYLHHRSCCMARMDPTCSIARLLALV